MAVFLLYSGGEIVIYMLFAGALILIAAFLIAAYILRDLFKVKKNHLPPVEDVSDDRDPE